MKFRYLFLLFLLCGFLLGCSTTKVPPRRQPDQEFDLYILMGQSNMAGRGQLTDSLKSLKSEKVWMLTRDLTWTIAQHPLHFDKPAVAGAGPGLSFGIAMSNANPKARIGLIPCAVGGTSIDKWQPGAFDQATSTHPYDDAVVRITTAMKHGKIKGMLWLQGESDSNEAQAKLYLEKLQILIGRIRQLTGENDLPVVIGELGRFKSNYQLINLELHKAPGIIRNIAVVTSEGLTDKGDQTHFDGRSATIYGTRFAAKMLHFNKTEY